MRRLAPWLVVVVLALVYPVVTLATGGPSFPTRDDCIRPAIADGDIDAVFGYFDTENEAIQVRDKAIAVGFAGTEVASNGCGRLRVAVGGIPTLEVGREFVNEARKAGFEVILEQAS